jgi:hypothetical protein
LKVQDGFSGFTGDVKERFLSLEFVFALALNLELEIAKISMLFLLIGIDFLRADATHNQRNALSTLLF